MTIKSTRKPLPPRVDRALQYPTTEALRRALFTWPSTEVCLLRSELKACYCQTRAHLEHEYQNERSRIADDYRGSLDACYRLVVAELDDLYQAIAATVNQALADTSQPIPGGHVQ